MSVCDITDSPSHSQPEEPASTRAAKSSSSHRGSSTASQISETSSGYFSLESGGCDSLSRAFQELGLRENSAYRGSAAQIDGWVERSCSQTISGVDDVEEDAPNQAELENEPDEEEAWDARTAIKRCSSLRSNSTGSSVSSESGRRAKKVVRFADSLGLDLIKVRHVVNLDSPPETEPALRRLDCRRDSLAPAPLGPTKRRLLISPCFAQPGSCVGFISRVMSQKVMLERASIDPERSVLSGQVRVCNLHFEKRVTVRVTFDSWRSCSEVAATYEASDSVAGMTDQFVFRVPLPAAFGASAGDRVVLCVRFDSNGQTYWDSNYGENYSFDCLPLGWGGDSEEDTFALARFS